jgi:hypothetical protein
LTEIYHLLGMKSFRDDLIDRMKTGWGSFVLASAVLVGVQMTSTQVVQLFRRNCS